MKRLFCIALLMLSACETARVLSDDGTKELATCSGDADWVECICKACPDGFDIVSKSSNGTGAIVKCKPYSLKK